MSEGYLNNCYKCGKDISYDKYNDGYCCDFCRFGTSIKKIDTMPPNFNLLPNNGISKTRAKFLRKLKRKQNENR
jgi:hypothetical protein